MPSWHEAAKVTSDIAAPIQSHHRSAGIVQLLIRPNPRFTVATVPRDALVIKFVPLFVHAT
jgi:hypothetical protein